MSAPPPALLAAIRSGEVVRELFFRLDHPSGLVLAWSGVGEYVLGGETYSGTAGLSSVSGVEETSDIQTHDVEVTLQGIPLSAAVDLNAPVRNRAAQIVALWRDASGAQVGATRTIFKGKADTLTVDHTGENLTVRLTLRSAAFDFRLTGQSYYSDNEQELTYPDDTGFSLMAKLSNKNSAGWSLSGSSGGGGSTKVYVTATGTGSAFSIKDTAGRRIVTEAGSSFRRVKNNVLYKGTMRVKATKTTYINLKYLHLGIAPTIQKTTTWNKTKVNVTKGKWKPIVIDGAGFLRAGTTTGEKLVVASDLRVYGETTGKRVMMVAQLKLITTTSSLVSRVNTARYAKARPL